MIHLLLVFPIGWTAADDITYLCAHVQVRETQALILAPTRELAGQIQKVSPAHHSTSIGSVGLGWVLIDSRVFAQVLLALGDYMNVQCHSCIGGTNVGEDIRKLDYGQHVVAGTPGRVFGETHAHTQTQLGSNLWI